MGRTPGRWELVMEHVPCPVRDRRIPGRGGVEEGRKGHMKWDLVVGNLTRPGQEEESQIG